MQRFLCDEMLARLGRWLRAAGYDTVIAEAGIDDRALLNHAMHGGRCLITRDRKILEMKGANGVVLLLPDAGMDAWAQILAAQLAVDWLYNPFCRCLVCNTPLRPGPGDYVGQLPDYVPAEAIPCFHCPVCARAFWPGGHTRRMRRRLKAWQAGNFSEKEI